MEMGRQACLLCEPRCGDGGLQQAGLAVSPAVTSGVHRKVHCCDGPWARGALAPQSPHPAGSNGGSVSSWDFVSGV